MFEPIEKEQADTIVKLQTHSAFLQNSEDFEAAHQLQQRLGIHIQRWNHTPYLFYVCTKEKAAYLLTVLPTGKIKVESATFGYLLNNEKVDVLRKLNLLQLYTGYHKDATIAMIKTHPAFRVDSDNFDKFHQQLKSFGFTLEKVNSISPNLFFIRVDAGFTAKTYTIKVLDDGKIKVDQYISGNEERELLKKIGFESFVPEATTSVYDLPGIMHN